MAEKTRDAKVFGDRLSNQGIWGRKGKNYEKLMATQEEKLEKETMRGHTSRRIKT